MIRWIARLIFGRKRKLLYTFFDGSKHRSMDPLAISQRLAEHPKYLPRHLHEARMGDREAIKIASDAACDAFGVHPVNADGKGMTVSDRISLLLGFDYWVDALKKNIGTSQS